MFEILKVIRDRRQSSDAIYEARFFKAFTENCGYNAFVASASTAFDWFDASAFNLLRSAVSCGADEYRERRRVCAISAMIFLFVLVEQLSLAHLGRLYFWKPSLGRWFVIQTVSLYWEAYWTIFARQVAVALLLALVCRLCANVARLRRDVEIVDEPRSVDAIARFDDRIDANFLNLASCSRLHRWRRCTSVSS